MTASPLSVSVLASIAAGAVLGAWARHGLSLWLNPLFGSLALGTLLANWSGAYLMGLAVGILGLVPEPTLHWRFFLLTGFLGAFTTFSAFSAEVVLALQARAYFASALTVLAHVLGSLALTAVGLACAVRLKHLFH